MKVLLIGATGFIGSEVVKKLVARQHDVLSLVRSMESKKKLEALGYQTILGDLDDKSSLIDAAGKSEIIIKLGNPSFNGRIRRSKLVKISIQMYQQSKNLLEVINEYHKIPVILTEGTLAYGESNSQPHTEQSEYNLRGFARAGTESVPYMQAMIQNHNLPAIIIQPGAVYGPGGWFIKSVYNLLRLGVYRYFGQGKNQMSFVHVEDLSTAYVLAVEKLPIGEKFLVVDDEPVSIINFSNFTAQQMGKKNVKNLPIFLANLFAGKTVVESLTINCKASNNKIKEELGWNMQFPTYKDGIPYTLRKINS